jgi:hypothetical protein
MTRLTALRAAAALLAAPLAAAPSALGAQESRSAPFSWTGAAASGSWLRLRNVNGSVRVEGTSGGEVEVRATKRWRRGNPEDVQIRVTRYGPGDANVLVCAIWRDAECDENGYRSNNDRRGRGNDNDVSVEFVVRVPRGVNVAPGTVNGSVTVADVAGEVRASAVNGAVEASSLGGPVSASTVNGDVDVRMSRVSDQDLTFNTVNGSVTVALPERLDAEIELRTVNGSLRTDYPLTISGRVNPRRIDATVGRGGPRLRFSTVNGSVTLRKGA